MELVQFLINSEKKVQETVRVFNTSICAYKLYFFPSTLEGFRDILS